MRIYGLKRGARIRVKKNFLDFDGSEVKAGWDMVLRDYDVFPYEDGHTLTFFNGRVIRLSGNEPANVPMMDDVDDEYWELVL